ncbi:hypothetical protein E2C01_086589 [Portunus trituberculatus]|uniref:Uncharacterized protein n=1 Tax=Portunus trituberculatus TaxID=210409 RepID=A0A5B7JGS2_PORTR|nr:hypothetical protein [Portunus trituberculatus]
MGKHGSKLTVQGQNLACLGGQILSGDGIHRQIFTLHQMKQLITERGPTGISFWSVPPLHP